MKQEFILITQYDERILASNLQILSDLSTRIRNLRSSYTPNSPEGGILNSLQSLLQTSISAIITLITSQGTFDRHNTIYLLRTLIILQDINSRWNIPSNTNTLLKEFISFISSLIQSFITVLQRTLCSIS